VIICDTGQLVAVLNADDKYHDTCCEFFENERDPLIEPLQFSLKSGTARMPEIDARPRGWLDGSCRGYPSKMRRRLSL
jgi:hypothetical protein